MALDLEEDMNGNFLLSIFAAMSLHFIVAATFSRSQEEDGLVFLHHAASWMTLRLNGDLLSIKRLDELLGLRYKTDSYYRSFVLAFQHGLIPKMVLKENESCNSTTNSSKTVSHLQQFVFDNYRSTFDLPGDSNFPSTFCDYRQGLVCNKTSSKCQCPSSSMMSFPPNAPFPPNERCLVRENENCDIIDLGAIGEDGHAFLSEDQLSYLIFDLERPLGCVEGTQCRFQATDLVSSRCYSTSSNTNWMEIPKDRSISFLKGPGLIQDSEVNNAQSAEEDEDTCSLLNDYCPQDTICYEDFSDLQNESIYMDHSCNFRPNYTQKFRCKPTSDLAAKEFGTCERSVLKRRIEEVFKNKVESEYLNLERHAPCDYNTESVIKLAIKDAGLVNGYKFLTTFNSAWVSVGMCDSTKLLECKEHNRCDCIEGTEPRRTKDLSYSSDYCYLKSGPCQRDVTQLIHLLPAEVPKVKAHYGEYFQAESESSIDCGQYNLCVLVDEEKRECISFNTRRQETGL